MADYRANSDEDYDAGFLIQLIEADYGSQKERAQRYGIDRSLLNRIICGHDKPRRRVALRLALGLNLDNDAFVRIFYHQLWLREHPEAAEDSSQG